MGIIILILVVAVIIFINIKINNLKYRAKQQILKNTGVSSSEINETVTEGLEKIHMDKLLQDNSNFTEDYLKEQLKEYVTNLIDGNIINQFSQKVRDHILKDSKIDKLKNMEFKRVNINYYSNHKFSAIVVYTDNRDEYNINLYCSIINNQILLDRYQIAKGMVVGF